MCLPRSALSALCDLIAYDLVRPTFRSNALPAETQLLAALQFYTTGSFQWMVGRSCGFVSVFNKSLLQRCDERVGQIGTEVHLLPD